QEKPPTIHHNVGVNGDGVVDTRESGDDREAEPPEAELEHVNRITGVGPQLHRTTRQNRRRPAVAGKSIDEQAEGWYQQSVVQKSERDPLAGRGYGENGREAGDGA